MDISDDKNRIQMTPIRIHTTIFQKKTFGDLWDQRGTLVRSLPQAA